MSITEPRRRNVDFSTPYLDADQGVLLRRNLPAPKTRAALARLKLCVQRSTTGADAVASRVKPARAPFRYASVDLLLEAVRTGRCDAAVLDAPILAAERAAAPYRYGALAGVIETDEQLRRRAAERLAAHATGLGGRSGAGRQRHVARLQRRWLATDLSKLLVLR